MGRLYRRKERTEVILGGKRTLCSLVTVTPSSLTAGTQVPSAVSLCSQRLMQDLDSHFQPTWQL